MRTQLQMDSRRYYLLHKRGCAERLLGLHEQAWGVWLLMRPHKQERGILGAAAMNKAKVLLQRSSPGRENSLRTVDLAMRDDYGNVAAIEATEWGRTADRAVAEKATTVKHILVAAVETGCCTG